MSEKMAVAFYICVALFALYYGVQVVSTEPIKLPCGVSEISPDFDHNQREQCRKIRGHKL